MTSGWFVRTLCSFFESMMTVVGNRCERVRKDGFAEKIQKSERSYIPSFEQRVMFRHLSSQGFVRG